MTKTSRTSSFVRAALGGAALGLTLAATSAYAQPQANPAPITDATPSPDISASAGSTAAPAVQPQARLVIVSPYTAPSPGGGDIPSNHRGNHNNEKPSS